MTLVQRLVLVLHPRAASRGVQRSRGRNVPAWAAEQACLLRAGRLDQLDIEHIADETEDVGKGEKRELAGRMAVLLARSLKWQAQPKRRSNWERTIREGRKQARRKLKETPSLGPLVYDPDWTDGAWGDAVTLAISEMSLDALPEACPWPMADVLAEGWLPGWGGRSSPGRTPLGAAQARCRRSNLAELGLDDCAAVLAASRPAGLVKDSHGKPTSGLSDC